MQISIELAPTEDFLREEESDAKGALDAIEEMEVETQEDLDFVSSMLVDVKTKKKELEAERKKITAPLTQALEATRKLFRGPIQYLGKCEVALKAKISEAHRRAEEVQRKALEAASKAVSEGDKGEARQALEKAVSAPLGRSQGVSLRDSWTYEVEDMDAFLRGVLEGAVPADLVGIDDVAMKALLRKKKGAVKLPGIKVVKETIVAARSKK